MKLPPEREIRWDRTYRIIPSRYPPVDLFERIGDPGEWEILAAIEGLTNDRIRDEVGDIQLVPPQERISGPGASPIMAAFTHAGFPSRFTSGTYGVYYASDRIEGALREVAYHQERFLRRTSEPKARLEMRAYIGSARGPFFDVRAGWPAVHDRDNYGSAQALGQAIHDQGGNGIVYDNVRRPGASNLAAFRPKPLAAKNGRAHVIQGPHYFLDWTGAAIDRFIEVGKSEWRKVAELDS